MPPQNSMQIRRCLCKPKQNISEINSQFFLELTQDTTAKFGAKFGGHALILTYTASALLVHRNHLTFGLIAAQDQQLTGPQQCTTGTQIYFYALKPFMQLAIIDLFSSLRGFFVGQRHQLLLSLPSIFVFVPISISSR
jgi:hypothetical protein